MQQLSMGAMLKGMLILVVPAVLLVSGIAFAGVCKLTADSEGSAGVSDSVTSSSSTS